MNEYSKYSFLDDADHYNITRPKLLNSYLRLRGRLLQCIIFYIYTPRLKSRGAMIFKRGLFGP